MKHIIRNFYLTVVFILSAMCLYAGNGESLFPFLKVSPTAKAAGMGDAFVAIADDASASYYNPAGLAQLELPELTLSHMEYLLLTKYEYVNCAIPITNIGTIGFQTMYFNYGAMNFMKETNTGYFDEASSTGKFSSYDVCAALSFGRYLIHKKLSAGLTAKYIKEKIHDSEITGFAYDAGLLWHTPIDMLSLGTQLQNIGSKINQEKLPTNFKLGMLLTLSTFNKNDLLFAVDSISPMDNSSNNTINIGADYAVSDYGALRAGYQIGHDVTSYTLGLSLKMINSRMIVMHIDYAYMPYDELGETHRISLRTRFGELE